MVANNARVEFLGLTGVVPNRNNPQPTPSSYLVVLPDLENGRQDSELPNDQDEELPGVVPPHVAAVIVPSDAVVSESRKHVALQFRSREGIFAGRNYSLYLLEGERLGLEPLEESPLDAPYVRVEPTVPGYEVPNRPGEENGLQWIPRLSVANAGNGRSVGKFAREQFLYSDWTPRPTNDLQLTGTVLIEHGRFFVSDVIRKGGKPAEFEFIVPNQRLIEWKQARYSRMLWDSDFEGDRLDLTFTGGSWDAPGRVSLRVLDGRCDIWVANLELEALLGVGRETPRNTRADLDFAVLYLYCTNVPNRQQGMPVPHDPPGIGGGSPRCGSSMFDE